VSVVVAGRCETREKSVLSSREKGG
jgi:hypothetical protein